MRTFSQNACAARFLLGGIGTGNISIDQNARLCDFELWNKPNKKHRSPYTFFAVRTQDPDGGVHTKALESQLAPPYMSSHGAHAWEVGGLPRFRESEMTGSYPFVNFKLFDKNMPIEATIEAFTPLIPLNTDDSSLPAFVLRYGIKNIADKPLTVSVAGSLANLCNPAGVDAFTTPMFEAGSVNEFVAREKYTGIRFLPGNKKESDPNYLEMALLTTERENVSYLDEWNEGAWWDGIRDFWNDFTEDGELTSGRQLQGKGNSLHQSRISVASLCIKKEIPSGESAQFEFVVSWYHPNRIKSWSQDGACCCEGCGCETVRNYYAKFGPPIASAEYLIDNLDRLESLSRKFADAVTSSTLPEPVLDAVLSNITVIRSTTCFRIEDGTFFAYEGCHDGAGCCEGNCTHVWNYTQTMAYLFPELERSMRKTEFITETDDEGRMRFRALSRLDGGVHDMPPAADGQLGAVVRLYRDWMLCGSDDFIREMWPKAKLALEYAFKHWDIDGDGVMEGEQHNTYDIEFYGMSSMLNSIYYAALRAGEQISRYLGDEATADKYAEIRQKGAAKIDELTFNGEYYIQLVDDANEHKYQYGNGCIADMLLGQYLAHCAGLGYVLDEGHVKSAVRSVFKYNFKEDLSDHENVQRAYALGSESGLILCSWPSGGRPQLPFVYSDEVWTGIEYQVAAHLIYEGFLDEGLRIVEACRDRHDGVKRSPWDEVECGHHYARSLASYGVYLALTGFHCDAVNKVLTFEPRVNAEDFSCFFCCADGWGIYRKTKMGAEIETIYGDLVEYRVV